MNNVLDRPSKQNSRVTLRSLRREIAGLRSRIEDLEDLRELNQATERNVPKPLIPWSKAKKTLGLA